MKAFWAAVEAKVKAAALGALLASVVAAIINALLNGSPIPHNAHEWGQFLVTVALPPVVAFMRGYAAPHQSTPPVPPAQP